MHRYLRGRWRDSDEEGFSLIELMVAVFILAVAILALAGVATSSIMRVRIARDQQQASDLASAELESARGIRFDALALSASPGAPPAPYSAEPLAVSASTGPLAPTQTVTQGGQSFTVRRWITRPTPAASQDAIKRVVVTVSWSDRGTVRSVTDSTVVAPADRGLPVPQFDLSPTNRIVALTPGDANPVCVTHLVTNLGLTDTYHWRLENKNDSSAVTALGNGAYLDNARKLRVRAYFQPVDPAASGPSFTATWEMNTTASSSPTWYAAQPNAATPATRLLSKRSAWLSVCYQPLDSSNNPGPAGVSNASEYIVRVRSAFDTNVREASQNKLTIGEAVLPLYLHEKTNNHKGNWNGDPHVRKIGKLSFPPMPMDTKPNPADWAEHNMDTDLDSAGVFGLRFPGPPAGLTATQRRDQGGIWDFAVGQSRNIRELKLFVHAAYTEPPTSGSVTPRLSVSVERVTTSGALIKTVLPTQTITYGPTSLFGPSAANSFVPVTATFNLDTLGISAGDRTMNPGELLRLRIWCADTSNANCHLSFDTKAGSNTYVGTSSLVPTQVQRGILEVWR